METPKIVGKKRVNVELMSSGSVSAVVAERVQQGRWHPGARGPGTGPRQADASAGGGRQGALAYRSQKPLPKPAAAIAGN